MFSAFTTGAAALLLRLAGTLPVQFRGVTYRFPVSIWVPHDYPREPPIAYVTPSGTMAVRPGQHVDPQGQIFHPYLNHWASMWDVSVTMSDLTFGSRDFDRCEQDSAHIMSHIIEVHYT